MKNLADPSSITHLYGDGAVIVHSHNVMDPRDRDVFQCRDELSLKDVAPKTSLPLVCSVNGEFVHPADWELVEPCKGDVVVFTPLPKGGGGGSAQSVLGIILIVAGVLIPGAEALIYVGAALLVSGLLPTPSVTPLSQVTSDAPSPTYNVQLSGNSARLGQAIPVLYGRHLITPDFAAAPYTTFDESDNQFYYALLSIGVMDEFTVISTMIDDTEISHFVDVTTQFIGPQFGTTLTLVNPAIVNAPEVANQELPYGSYVGPFAACGPGLQANKIGIDVVCPRGLFFADDTGALTPKTVSWMVEARKITSSGAVSGSWTLLGTQSLTLAQNKPVRRSYLYSVPSGRYEIRVQRLEAQDTNNRAAHGIEWAGMRAHLTVSVPLDDNANFLALRMKASNQLSGLSQRRVSLIIQRKLPTWTGAAWSAPVETNSIAWALADVLKNPVYGGKVPDSRIDLDTLADLEAIWAARGDEFNGVFDRRITLWAALTVIARAGRARPIMRGNVFTFIRDQVQDLPVALFNMRNIERGSFNIGYSMVTEDTPDGVEIEFFDRNKWSSNYVTVPLPGVVGEPLNPAKITLQGITDVKHVEREALYMAADAAYRRSFITFSTEMEGYLPAFGDLIAVSHDVTGWGVSGEIESYTGAEVTCVENLQWSVGPNYAILVDDQGDVHGPYEIVPGSNDRSFVFVGLSSPPITLQTDTEMERTRFAMGAGSAYAKMCRVVAITPATDDRVQIRAVVEDNRVHTADQGVGGGSGSGSRTAGYAPDGIPTYDAASDAQHTAYCFFSEEDRTVGSADDSGYVYTV